MGWREHRSAPGPGWPLCRLDSVADGHCIELRFGADEGLLSLLLYRRRAEVRAYVNSCPHFSLPLNARPHSFLLLAGARIMCAWHCAVFDLASGTCLEGPSLGLRLESVSVDVRDGAIYVAAE
jgi:nitrite reductase/ring-hydroxylating ferredoxin subunit